MKQIIYNYFFILIISYQLAFINCVKFNFINKCNYVINLYSHENFKFNKICDIQPNQNDCNVEYNYMESGLFKHTWGAEATLFEYTINKFGMWYDISVIPPGSGNCISYDDCRKVSKAQGFNVPMTALPKTNNPNYKHSCVNLRCYDNACPDAYLYPYDDTKTKYCPLDTNFEIIFCENNQPSIIPTNSPSIIPTKYPVYESYSHSNDDDSSEDSIIYEEKKINNTNYDYEIDC